MGEKAALQYTMQVAQCEFYTGADRELLLSFMRFEADAAPDDPNVVLQSRIVWMAMAKLALDGKVVLTGHLERSPISQSIPAVLLPISDPDFQRHMLQTNVGTFYDVRVGALQEGGHLRGAVHPYFIGRVIDEKRDGWPVRCDWAAFRRERVRAVGAGGLSDRSAIRAHMQGWCAQKWGSVPDDRTFHDQLSPLLDVSIP